MGQYKGKQIADIQLPSLRQRTEKILRGAGAFTQRTFMLPQAFVPFMQLLGEDENITREQLSAALDEIFTVLYEHPLNEHGRKLTSYLRHQNYIPNEETTENLIRYVLNQVISRSPVAIPETVINEFWTFFHELFSEPELKGLVELNLDILRLVLRTYEPLLVDLINLLKETQRINQTKLTELANRVQVIRGDLVIIRRQIKALRYIKPFFETDPKDFASQAQIVVNMVQEFGPFFIKMAQVAACNSDFLPEQISKELVVFQEDVPPMSVDEVMDAFQECYGKSPYECYFDFDAERPIKSGSIGSIYLAKKPSIVNGKEVLTPVIIKIGRHNLDREFLMGKTVIGLALLSSQYWAPHSKLAPFLEALSDQVDVFVDGFNQELDFEEEARVQQRFSARSQDSKLWNVPAVFSATRRILEMEYLEGATSINNAMEAFSVKNPKMFQRQIAEKFLNTILIHIFIYHEFHGDLHPGNIMVNPEGELFLIDWGNTVHLKGKWKPVFDYAIGAISADVELLTDALINISTEPEANLARRDEILKCLEDTLNKKDLQPLGLNFIPELWKGGSEGIQRRIHMAMHLMTSTQQLGIVVKSEYLHLSRSLFALTGSYTKLYNGVPKPLMLFDLCRTVTQFPLHFLKDQLEMKRSLYRKQMKSVVPFYHFFGDDSEEDGSKTIEPATWKTPFQEISIPNESAL